MEESRNRPEDEAAVREVIEAWAAAVRRKDLAGILRNHSSDVVMYDVPPPFLLNGMDSYRASWELFFSWSGDPVLFEITGMSITAGADVAFAVATMRCAGRGVSAEPQPLDFRLTVGLRKIAGQWTIVHEHHSVPAEN